MKHSIRVRIFALVLFCCLSLSLSTDAFASYNPQYQNATPAMFIELIAEQLDVPADVNGLIELGVITDSDYEDMRIWAGVSVPIAARVLLLLYDIPIYPSDLFSGVRIDPAFSTMSLFDVDAVGTAIALGLIDPSAIYTRNITEAVLLTMIEKLENGDYALIGDPEPPCAELIADIECECHCDCSDYRYRRRVLVGLSKLPSDWVEDFYASGWSIERGMREDYADSAVGLASYGERKIYLADTCHAGTVTHEFAHYVIMRLGWNRLWSNYLDQFYEEGIKSRSEMLREYSWTNQDEYIADFVMYWIEYPDQQPALAELAPKTAQFVLQLLESYADMVRC